MRAGGWQRTIGLGLAGRTLGVIGLGRLGAIVAEIARAFQMEVVAWSQNLGAARASEVGATPVTKAELLARSDFVTLHLRLGDRTRGLIGGAELAAMKPSAWLINTSRGPIVDEAALIDALERRVIAGAALDVYDQEPLPEAHPLRRLDNTVLSPHVGYVTAETYRVFYAGTVAAVRAWLDGAPIRLLTAPA